MEDAELIGQVVKVVTRIEGGDDPGEVSVLADGIWERYFAHAPVEIPVGRTVLIVNHRGHRTVDVEPWAASPA